MTQEYDKIIAECNREIKMINKRIIRMEIVESQVA